MVRVQFLLSWSCDSCVLFSIRWLEFLFFWFEKFKLFPVKAHFFRRTFISCTFSLQPWCFGIAPARGSPVIVIGHALTSRDYIKLNRSGLDFLVLVCRVQTVLFWMLFSNLLQLISSWLHGSCSVFAFMVFWFLCFVLQMMTGFFGFLVGKVQTVFPLKLIFSVGPSFIARSVCNHGALKLRLHVVALPASLAMSWPGEFTKLEQVRTWLLSSSLAEFQQFYSEWFFFNFASVYFFLATWFMFNFCPWGLVILLFCSPNDDWIFFVFWFENFKLFPVKAHFFRRTFNLCTFSL